MLIALTLRRAHGDVRTYKLTKRSARAGLSQEEIFGNALIFLFAGYDTTSSALAFTLFSLAANESCLQKALREVDEKVGQVECDFSFSLLLLLVVVFLFVF